MGNQSSGEAKRNKYLTDAQSSAIQQTFKSGKLNKLPSSWDIFESEAREKIEKYLKSGDGSISYEKYQDLAGNSLNGPLEEKVRFFGVLLGERSTYTVKDIRSAFKSLFKAMRKIYNENGGTNDESKLTDSLLHDIVHKGEKRKSTVGKEGDETIEVDQGDLENLLSYHPIIEDVLFQVLSKCFMFNSAVKQSSVPYKTSSISILQLLFLNHSIPHKFKNIWRPLFSTNTDGESFAKFAGSIMNRGPTILIIKDNEGNVFGGYASDSWRLGPNFFGTTDCFLFHLHPYMNVYDSTPFNQNFQYFNLKQKTMPNGLGQGGQLDYFGYWLDSEFGLLKTAPSCSTYHSPQLGVQEGKLEALEVWGVGPEPDADELGGSVLNMDPELQAVMEMMGKTFHSKAIREVDAKEEEDKERREEFEQP